MGKMLIKYICISILLGIFTIFAQIAYSDNPSPGTIEIVTELPINPGNLAVTSDGRIFATVHQFRRAPVQLIEITGRGEYRPWPSETWNGPFGSGPHVFNSLLGIQIDIRNRLWVIDNGRGELNQIPKLLAFNIENEDLVFRYDFPPETSTKGTFLNDLAVDDKNGFVYIADIGGELKPAIVVVDINKKTSRRFENHPSLEPEDADLVVEGKVIKVQDNEGNLKPARIGVNPITLSIDCEILYFGAMNGKTWYSLPTKLFRQGASDNEIANSIKAVGPKPVSDGASTDAEGNHFFTNVGENAIDILAKDGNVKHLVQDDRLIWPDALSFGEEYWLYIAVNQLNRAPVFNGGKELGKPPYLIMRVWTGTRGIPGQ
ncbi:MAG: L-dopachrome tautomerase-related protein [Thermodesulfobacteriota bacterium]